MVMFTIRNVGGTALLLAGSTWLWPTPAFASRGVSTSGVLWALTRVTCLLTVAAFVVATWGLFTRHSWWETAALGSAVLGLISLIRTGSPLGLVGRPPARRPGARSCTS
jgi:hypothetical protein